MSRIVLVTGGARGIGAAITSTFLDQGCELVVVTRSEETLEEFRQEISLPEYRLHGYVADVSEEDSVIDLAASLTDALPRIDVLVNNVGGFYFQSMLQQDSEQWNEMVGTNLNSVYYMVKHLHPLLKRSDQGRIINLAAAYASVNSATERFGGYAALKTAVLSMTKSLSVELASDGITVNAVSPGMIDTGVYHQETIEKYSKIIPLKRFGEPSEVARAVSFFAEEESDYITGAEIVVSGGWAGETGS